MDATEIKRAWVVSAMTAHVTQSEYVLGRADTKKLAPVECVDIAAVVAIKYIAVLCTNTHYATIGLADRPQLEVGIGINRADPGDVVAKIGELGGSRSGILLRLKIRNCSDQNTP